MRARERLRRTGKPHDDLDRWIDKCRDEIPNFDDLLAQELARLDIALKIREARLSRSLSQEQLARRIGVSQPMIARLEREGNMSASVRTLAKVASALDYELKLELVPKRKKKTSAKLAAG